jgi:hypothetical protein
VPAPSRGKLPGRSTGQYEAEVAAGNKEIEPLYAKLSTA